MINVGNQISLRVALFLPSLRGGGAERVFVRMASRLAVLGHAVDIVLMAAKGVEYQDDLSSAVRIVDLKTPRLWTGLPAFRRYLHRERPDVVISAMPMANGIAALAARLAKRPPKLVLTEHSAISMAFGDLDVARYRPLMSVIRRSYRFADALVGVSEGVAARLRQMPGVQGNRVHVIHNPAWDANIEEMAAAPISRPWPTKADTPVLIAAGRLDAEKDFATLLRAFALVRQRRAARLILLGEGSQKSALEKLVLDLGIADDVAMPGFVKNPFSLMSRANVFVLSSRHEGLPTVLIEAMACGTPVVSTDCPSGPSEILGNGRFGSLVPVGDHGAMAAAIVQMLDAPAPAETLRRRARDFSVEASVDAYLSLVQSMRPALWRES